MINYFLQNATVLTPILISIGAFILSGISILLSIRNYFESKELKVMEKRSAFLVYYLEQLKLLTIALENYQAMCALCKDCSTIDVNEMMGSIVELISELKQDYEKFEEWKPNSPSSFEKMMPRMRSSLITAERMIRISQSMLEGCKNCKEQENKGQAKYVVRK